jgi:endonuclease/exonuclease/phosphatase (EEP) superfamily protein YafD
MRYLHWLTLGDVRPPNSGRLPDCKKRTRVAYILALATSLHLAVVLAAWALLVVADRWWVATALMYGPRWALGLPLAILLPAAILLRPRLVAICGLALLVLVGPVMGLCVPWQTVFQTSNGGMVLRVLSCNIHYRQLEPANVRAFVVDSAVDIVFLQGSPTNPQFGGRLEGFHVRQDNELVCFSRFPFTQVKVIGEHSAGPRGAAVRYDIETPAGSVHLFNLHLATPREGLSTFLAIQRETISEVEANIERRRLQSGEICKEVGAVKGATLIAGDFNTPAQSAIFQQYWSHYTDAFSTAGWGWGFTFYTRWAAVRIDHILAGPGWNCHRCWVAPAIGSPHRPLIAEFEWTGRISERVLARRIVQD